jgi:CheY-like chemotaxis protein
MIDDLGKMIERQLAHMARLLDDLLEVSRITRGVLELRTERLDMRHLLESTVESVRGMAENASLTVDVTLPDAPMPVAGDSARLVQILENLLNNAIRYTDRGGRIDVTGHTDSTSVTVEVRDTGIGIAASKLEQIFELFNQGERTARSANGLGIGLTLSRRLAELHSGRLEAHSAGPGTGSRFVFRLPRAPEVTALQESIASADKVAVLGAAGVRILVVDDNVDAADSLAQVLSLSGYDTRTAYDGAAVGAIVDAWQPEVVLLDLGLPSLSGYEVAQRLRQTMAGRALYLIAVTGWGSADDRRRTATAGFDEHLTKPVDPERLLQALAEARRHRAGDARRLSADAAGTQRSFPAE